MSTDAPKPPPPRYPDAPRPFREPWRHLTAAWAAQRALAQAPDYWNGRPLFTPFVAIFSFLGFGYGRWWKERR
jgi:hypothetical protein